uniref:Uncharacterized protein n=1 Tax=Caenorhabditis japonica TaxID=281687 RepID=A0A8R1E3S8_CAEJA
MGGSKNAQAPKKLEVLKLKISTGQFPLDSTLHIKKAVDVISSQIRHWNLGIQKSSEDARLLLEYFGALVKHVSDTPNKNGNSKWEPPVTRPTDADDTDLRVLIKKNIRELREAMPIADSMKLSESPEREQEDVRAPERSSETTTTVTSSEVAVEPVVRVIKRRNHSHPVPYFLTEDYLDRPRRTTKKNYALEDEMESEMVPKKRTRQKRENGEATSSELSPYNLTGTHLENDPLLNAPPSTAVAAPRRGTSRRGRGRRRGGFRGGRGSRGGYRHLAVASINPPDTDQPPHEPLFDADLDALHGDMGESFELEESDSEPEHDGVGSHEATPEPPQRTTEELFQELTGIGPSTSNGTNGNANNNSADRRLGLGTSSS